MRRIITTLVMAASLGGLVGTGLASAASPNADSTFVYSEPLEFRLEPGVCPDLPAGLSIDFTGTMHGHVHISTDARGVIHLNWPDTITGTAVDSDGNTYTFNYHNVAIASDDGFPILLTIVDHFNLVGNGGANGLHTFFVVRLLITEAGEEEVVFNGHGVPSCDAI